MRFFIHWGADIQPSVERYDSAALALEAVEKITGADLPNIRIVDAAGTPVSLNTLRQLAIEENENDDA